MLFKGCIVADCDREALSQEAPYCLSHSDPLDDVGKIGSAMASVAAALEAGTLAQDVGRLLLQILRESRETVSLWRGNRPELAGRDLTDDEVNFVTANGGKLPPGVILVFRAFRVDGPEWKP